MRWKCPLSVATAAAGRRRSPSAPPHHNSLLPTPQQVRSDVEQRTLALLAHGPAYLASLTLNDFNAEAAAQQKAGDHAAAAATYNALFAKARAANLTHPELYVCHSNAAAAYLALGLHPEALKHANKCQQLAEASLRRCVALAGADCLGWCWVVVGCWSAGHYPNVRAAVLGRSRSVCMLTKAYAPTHPSLHPFARCSSLRQLQGVCRHLPPQPACAQPHPTHPPIHPCVAPCLPAATLRGLPAMSNHSCARARR